MSIKNRFLLILCLLFSPHSYSKKITIMLNPAGDAQYAGRTIDGTFERGITLQCVERLKQELESRYSKVRVILTRVPGETIQHLQNASFANRLDVDLYISINFFPKKTGNPFLYLYYFCLNSVTDSWNIGNNNLTFTPYNKAHIAQLPLTKKIATTMFESFSKPCKNSFTPHPPLGMPFAPLIGIKAPAIGIEMSLQHSHDWPLFIPILTDSIGTALEQIKKKRHRRG